MDNEIKDFDIQLFRIRLKKRLKDCHTTQKALAAKIGVSEDTINKWFSGGIDEISGNKKNILPSLKTIYKVSQALDCSIDYLVNPDTDYLTVSNKMIGDKIGLSDKAINALIEDKKRPLHIIDTINLLLDNIHLQNVVKLFCNMYMFLITSPKCFKSLDGKFSSDYIILESNFEDKNHPALHGLGMGLSSDNVGGLFLQNITSDLSVIKDKL